MDEQHVWRVGDLARATVTKNGKTRTVEGQVVNVTHTRLRVEWERCGATNWSIVRTWVKQADAVCTGHVEKNIAQASGHALISALRENTLRKMEPGHG